RVHTVSKHVDNQGSPTLERIQKPEQLLSRSSNTHSLSNRGVDSDRVKAQRGKEAEQHVSKLLRTNVPGVLRLAWPTDENRKQLAMTIGKHIAADLESRMELQPRQSSRLASQPHQSSHLAP
ncbi:hypothetical protein EV175_001556, partial [Coemansia sp. RSA 1933]